METIQELKSAFKHLQALVDEKDEIIEELTNYIDDLEEENAMLRAQLDEEDC